MGFGIGEQLEPNVQKTLLWNSDKPWKVQDTRWRGFAKKGKVRRERRRVKLDPLCIPEYKRFKGWEY